MVTVLVSIVIPSYNSVQTILETVESALSQDYSDVEVIVVDDGSTDGTREALERKSYCGRIAYLSQKNQGVSAARNRGLEASRGQYVCFLDSDDLLETTFAREMVNLLRRTQCRIGYCNYRYFVDGSERRTLGLRYPVFEGDALGKIISEHFIPTPGVVLVERAAIGSVRFDPAMNAAEDWLFWFRLLQDNAIKFHSSILAHIRVRPGSLGRRKETMAKGVVAVMREIDRAVAGALGSRLSRHDVAKFRYRFASSLVEVRDFRGAFGQWAGAVRTGLPAELHGLLIGKVALEALGLRRHVERILWDSRAK